MAEPADSPARNTRAQTKLATRRAALEAAYPRYYRTHIRALSPDAGRHSLEEQQKCTTAAMDSAYDKAMEQALSDPEVLPALAEASVCARGYIQYSTLTPQQLYRIPHFRCGDAVAGLLRGEEDDRQCTFCGERYEKELQDEHQYDSDNELKFAQRRMTKEEKRVLSI